MERDLSDGRTDAVYRSGFGRRGCDDGAVPRVRDQPQDRLQVARAVRREGVVGLRERSHAPLRHGQAHDVAVVQAVLNLRARWGWGPKKLRVKLGELHPELPVPAASTIGDWLRHEGLVGRSRRRRRCPADTQPFTAVAAANDVWCTDFKGWFRTADGRR